MEDRNGSGVGSTCKGIGPSYRDRARRHGTRVEEWDGAFLNAGIHVYDILKPSKANYLFESAQGIMLDIDYGEYPYVTSSSVLPSIRYKFDEVIGVCKSYRY